MQCLIRGSKWVKNAEHKVFRTQLCFEHIGFRILVFGTQSVQNTYCVLSWNTYCVTCSEYITQNVLCVQNTLDHKEHNSCLYLAEAAKYKQLCFKQLEHGTQNVTQCSEPRINRMLWVWNTEHKCSRHPIFFLNL
jgi:hypothetical protein